MTSLAEAEVSERASAERASAESASAVCSQTPLPGLGTPALCKWSSFTKKKKKSKIYIPFPVSGLRKDSDISVTVILGKKINSLLDAYKEDIQRLSSLPISLIGRINLV